MKFNIKILSIFLLLMLSINSLKALNYSYSKLSKYNLIYAYGMIHKGDYYKLKSIYRRLPKYKQTIVVFNSAGGELNEGIKIGKFLKRYRIGSAVKKDGYCASSCALAFLGGRDRYGRRLMILPYGSKLGYHAFYYKNSRYVKASRIQADMSNLLNYMNYVRAPYSLIRKMFQTGAGRIYWIGYKERRYLRIKRGLSNLSFDFKYSANYRTINKPKYNITQTKYIRRYLGNINTALNSDKRYRFNYNTALNDSRYQGWLNRNLNNIYVKNTKLISSTKIKSRVIYSFRNGYRICSDNTYNLTQTSEGWKIVGKSHKACYSKHRKILRRISNYLP